MLDHYSSLFQEGLGTLKQTKVKFFLKEGTTPKFYKTHSVPLALQQRVTAELDRLQAEGILCPIKMSDWATPIVPVMKKDGTIRVCGDLLLIKQLKMKCIHSQESMNFLPPYLMCTINCHWMSKHKS